MRNRRYKASICGSYPGAAPFEWYAEAPENESAEHVEQELAQQFDQKYPDKAPHWVTLEEDD